MCADLSNYYLFWNYLTKGVIVVASRTVLAFRLLLVKTLVDKEKSFYILALAFLCDLRGFPRAYCGHSNPFNECVHQRTPRMKSVTSVV